MESNTTSLPTVTRWFFRKLHEASTFQARLIVRILGFLASQPSDRSFGPRDFVLHFALEHDFRYKCDHMCDTLIGLESTALLTKTNGRYKITPLGREVFAAFLKHREQYPKFRTLKDEKNPTTKARSRESVPHLSLVQ